MTTDEKYMHLCFQLARKAIGCTSPNPMVGAVIVHEDKIIGEGYHVCCGQAHAEANAIRSVKDKELLAKSTLYVNLEPCSHHGKTPPCAQLIIDNKIPHVIISNIDPFPKVSGRGIAMLQQAGVQVTTGIFEAEGRELNKRFFTFYEKHRPYIILKWAQSSDNFMDAERTELSNRPTIFSSQATQMLNHKLRAEEDAILVGTNTVLLDNPQLTTRMYEGKNPVRIILDREGRIPQDYKIYDGVADTLIFTKDAKENNDFANFVTIDFSENILQQVLDELYRRQITSLIVEGGSKVLHSFIAENLWDEAKVETAPFALGKGVKAPILNLDFLQKEEFIGENKIQYFKAPPLFPLVGELGGGS